MQQNDLEKLFKELDGINLKVPLHQRALRKRLMELHAAQPAVQPLSLTHFKSQLGSVRVLLGGRKILSIGAVIIVTGIIVLGLIVLQPSANNPHSKRLIAEAAESITPRSPGKPAKASQTYTSLPDRRSGTSNSQNGSGGSQNGGAPTGSNQQEVTDEAPGYSVPEPSTTPKPPANQSNAGTNPVVIIIVNTGGGPILSTGLGTPADDKQARKEEKAQQKEEKHAIKATLKATLKSGLLNGILGAE
jgi:hypothetical protein